LVLDTGDALVGGGWLGELTQGAVVVSGMNLMGYDALALGPQELTLGLDTLRQRMEEAAFPMLSANVVLSGTEELLAEPFTVIQVGDHRLGIIGLTRPLNPAGAGMATSASSSRPARSVRVLDPQEAAARFVPQVAEQAGTIIVLTNLDHRAALALAEAVPGIDLLIAALPEQLPGEFARVSATGTIVVSAEQPAPRHTGRRVGRLVVTVDGEGNLSGESWASHAMDKTLADDLLMDALLKKAEQ
jgi:2',3'-cyclic-nucleotide 2'-phosphodiesterase (5'-nucleotidase family)